MYLSSLQAPCASLRSGFLRTVFFNTPIRITLPVCHTYKLGMCQLTWFWHMPNLNGWRFSQLTRHSSSDMPACPLPLPSCLLRQLTAFNTRPLIDAAIGTSVHLSPWALPTRLLPLCQRKNHRNSRQQWAAKVDAWWRRRWRWWWWWKEKREGNKIGRNCRRYYRVGGGDHTPVFPVSLGTWPSLFKHSNHCCWRIKFGNTHYADIHRATHWFPAPGIWPRWIHSRKSRVGHFHFQKCTPSCINMRKCTGVKSDAPVSKQANLSKQV